MAHGQGTGLHVAAEVAPPCCAGLDPAQLALIEGLGPGIDPASAAAAAAAVPPRAMQGKAGAADPALPPPLGLQSGPQHKLGLR